MPRSHNDDDEGFPRRRSRFQDDDDGDDDRPRRRGSEGNSGIGLVIAFGVVGLVVVIGAIGLLGFFLLRDNAPAEVAEEEKQPPVPAAVQRRLPGFPADPVPDPVVEQPARPGPNNFLPPPEPPKKKVVAVPGVVAIPSINPRITQIVFGGGPDGYAAIVAYKDEGVGMQVDIVQTATGNVKGRITTESASDNNFAVSPDGSWLAVLGSAPGEGHPVRLYSFNGQQVNVFTPYPRGGAKGYLVPEAVWAAFIAKDRLSTINESGGFDVWSVPGFQRVAGQPGRKSPALPRVQINLFTRCPVNFALTPDGKKLALFNGTGYSFYDSATANATGHTPAFMKANDSANFYGAAFSPDGKRFASYFATYGAGSTTGLAIWDTASGKLVGGGATKESQSPAGMGWWGPNHLLFWRGGVADADLFSIESRQVIGRLVMKIPGKVATVPPNGQVWGTAGQALFDRDTGASFLIRADIPAKVGAKARFELTPEGLKTK